MNMPKLKLEASSIESDPDNPASASRAEHRNPVHERRWPWSTSHFDWMDEYCPMPAEMNEGEVHHPVLADVSQ